jgi:transcriptional regulator with XRE-family HTH domain
MAGIGLRLRTIRRQWQLSLREVEERSLRFAQQQGNQSYQVSASWLDRLEREEHELTVNKLIVLADIYNLPTEQLLRSIYPGDAQPLSLRQLSSPNATMLLTEGPLEEQAKYLLPDTIGLDLPPDETRLLASENSSSLAPYRRGIIGKRDRTLDPMIPAGSIVQIDTQKRAISSRRDWTHEFQRPVYFLITRDAYVCGWCELGQGFRLVDAHTPPSVPRFQPAMEVPKRNRKHWTRRPRGYSTDRVNLTGLETLDAGPLQVAKLWLRGDHSQAVSGWALRWPTRLDISDRRGLTPPTGASASPF